MGCGCGGGKKKSGSGQRRSSVIGPKSLKKNGASPNTIRQANLLPTNIETKAMSRSRREVERRRRLAILKALGR
jgi:hypothetical protein